MALNKLIMKPGVNTDVTRLQNEGCWSDADKVRFRQGQPETIGGWVKYSTSQFTGMARGLFSWQDLNTNIYVTLGTDKRLYLGSSAVLYNITPIRLSVTLGLNPFTTGAAGSTLVTVAHTAHGAVQGDYVTYASATATDGIPAANFNTTLNVTRVVDANNYVITVATPCTTGATAGGGTPTAAYEINTGSVSSSYGSGWGSGSWGHGGWGSGSTTTGGLLQYLRTWSFDNWGEFLIANPWGGSMYVWQPAYTVTGVATLITGSSVPARVNQVLVSVPDRHLVALGCTDITGVFDPLLVRWSDTEDYTNFYPQPTNAAGDQRLGDGTKIVGAVRTSREIVIYTDASAYSMQYQGAPYIFGFQPVGKECGLIGPNAAVQVGSAVYHMARGSFFVYEGSMNVLPCTVLERVFDNMNVEQGFKVYAGLNSRFNEVWWHYCSAASAEIDRYVVYNYVEKLWTIGSLTRTSWHDDAVIGQVLATGTDGYIYAHETGTSANGAALDMWIESGDMDIGDGDQIAFVDRIIPDFSQTGNLTMTLKAKNYTAAAYRTHGPYTITPTTQKVDSRLRGRQLQLRIESSATDASWRFGAVRVSMKGDGQR